MSFNFFKSKSKSENKNSAELVHTARNLENFAALSNPSTSDDASHADGTIVKSSFASTLLENSIIATDIEKDERDDDDG